MAVRSIIMLLFGIRCKNLTFINGSLISVFKKISKIWGRGSKDFYWLPEIFACYQLFLNSWSPGERHRQKHDQWLSRSSLFFMKTSPLEIHTVLGRCLYTEFNNTKSAVVLLQGIVFPMNDFRNLSFNPELAPCDFNFFRPLKNT